MKDVKNVLIEIYRDHWKMGLIPFKIMFFVFLVIVYIFYFKTL